MSIKGENSILYIYDGAAYKPVACLTSNSLKSTLSIIESTTKCYRGVVKKTAGQINYTIDAQGEYIDTTSVGGDDTKASHDKLLALQMAKTKVIWKLDTDVTNAGSVKYYGEAFITDLDNTAGSGDDLSTFSATLSGDGAIVLTDPS